MTAQPTVAAARPAWHRSPEAWRFMLLRYLPFMALANLAWEIVQLPLYTIWTSASAREIAFAVVHCTAGDVLIAAGTLFLALMVTDARAPRTWPLARIAAITIVSAMAFTILSEWIATQVRQSWTYSELMPVVPVIGVGLSPLLQWIAIPAAAFWREQRRRSRPAPPVV
ncbi:MAG: hypothetical protein HYU77_04530 [Betaproteobacteria bacterium]|nr:hypothetical protein [Betaproteobacteria bacterium]